MPQCQFPVSSCFCVLEKLHRKYSQNWTKQGPEVLFFPKLPEDQKRAGGGGAEAAHTHRGRGPAPGRAPLVCGAPVCPLMTPLSLYKASGRKTLEESANFQKEFRSSTAAVDKFQGTKVSVPAPYRDGEVPPEPSPSTLLSPMMGRE
jgi:hypothetical protein